MRKPLKHINAKDNEYLFYGTEHLKHWFPKIVNKVSKRLNLGPFASHNIRHAVGYHLLRAGCDIRYIQVILGHKRLSNTQIYTRVDKEDLKSVLDKYHPRVIFIKEKIAV